MHAYEGQMVDFVKRSAEPIERFRDTVFPYILGPKVLKDEKFL